MAGCCLPGRHCPRGVKSLHWQKCTRRGRSAAAHAAPVGHHLQKSRRVLTRRPIIMLKRRGAGSSGPTIGLLWLASAWAGIELTWYPSCMISSATKYAVCVEILCVADCSVLESMEEVEVLTGNYDDAAEAWRTRERGVHLEDGGTTTDEVESGRARAGGSLEELYSMGRAAWRERRMSRLQGILFASRRRAKRRKKELQSRADRGCEDGRQNNTGSIMDCAVACVCRRSGSFFEWCWLMAAFAAAAVYCVLRSTSCSVRGEQARRMAILASKWRLSQARMSGGSRGMEVPGMVKEARRGPESPLCSLTSASNAGNLHPIGGGCPGQRAAPGYSGAMALISSTSAPSPLRTGKPVRRMAAARTRLPTAGQQSAGTSPAPMWVRAVDGAPTARRHGGFRTASLWKKSRLPRPPRSRRRWGCPCHRPHSG